MKRKELVTASLSGDGKSLAILARRSAAGEELRIWNVHTNKISCSSSLGEDAVTDVAHVDVPKGRSFVVFASHSGLSSFDPSSGEICHSSSTIDEGEAIMCLCALPDGGVATGSSNGILRIWDISSRGKLKMTRVVKEFPSAAITSLMAAKNTGRLVAVGQKTITLYGLGEGRTVKMLSGHAANNITELVFFMGGRRIASCAESDTSVLVWDVFGERSDPIFSATLPGVPHALTVSPSSDTLSAVVDGVVYQVGGIDSSDFTKRVRPLRDIHKVSFSSDPICAAYYTSVPDRLLTVRGSMTLPCFEIVDCIGRDQSLEREPVIDKQGESSRKQGHLKKTKTSTEIISGATAPIRVHPDKYLQEQEIEEDEEMIVSNQDKGEGLTSITNLLIQGLHSNSSQLIESSLKVTDERIIAESIEKLPQAVSPLLLETLVKKVVKRPARVTELSAWIKCLHLTHGSYLCSRTNYQTIMRPLQDCIATNTASYPLLLRVKANLEMMAAQKACGESEGSGNIEVPMAEDYVEYVELYETRHGDDGTSDEGDYSLPDRVYYSAAAARRDRGSDDDGDNMDDD